MRQCLFEKNDYITNNKINITADLTENNFNYKKGYMKFPFSASRYMYACLYI